MTDIPLTVIGGYLGSGKTTLVNHLLRESRGGGLAVLVNEFGELAVDGALIEAEAGRMVELAGGCVCCAYGDDLAGALGDVIALDPPPKQILVEASGVALPGAIVTNLQLMSGVGGDAVIVVCDAETLAMRRADRWLGDTIERQLRNADLVVLNRSDCADERTIARARDVIAADTPAASIIETVQAAVEPAIALTTFVDRARDGTRNHAGHTTRIETPGREALDAFAQALAEDPMIVRAKGFARGPDGAMRLLQLVGARFTWEPADDGCQEGIVVISVQRREPPS